MYLEHYGLGEFPFSITPDTHFFAKIPQHVEALEVLKVSLQQGEGFIKIIGEVGTGKTLLCRCLLHELERDFITAYIPNPNLSSTQLYAAFAEELGLSNNNKKSSYFILKQITEKLIELHDQNKRVVLLVDEAQALAEESLESIRLLTNLETEKTKLLQVVLFGQPELNHLLRKRSLRQLAQRITFSYTLKPLNQPAAIEYYLNHRLGVAGYSGIPLFERTTVGLLANASGGIPRLVNILAHKALMVAYGVGERIIRPDHVKRAIVDTESSFQYPTRSIRVGRFVLSPQIIGGLVAGGMLLTALMVSLL